MRAFVQRAGDVEDDSFCPIHPPLLMICRIFICLAKISLRLLPIQESPDLSVDSIAEDCLCGGLDPLLALEACQDGAAGLKEVRYPEKIIIAADVESADDCSSRHRLCARDRGKDLHVASLATGVHNAAIEAASR